MQILNLTEWNSKPLGFLNLFSVRMQPKRSERIVKVLYALVEIFSKITKNYPPRLLKIVKNIN